MARNAEGLVRPPEGGWGWIIVLGVFVTGIFTWGVLLSYTVFYQPLMSEFNVGLGRITWVSGAHELGRAFGNLSMPMLSARYGFRIPSMVLSLLSGIFISFSYLCFSDIPLYFLLGLFPGFMLGNLSVTSYVMISHYFKKKRILALSLSQCGNAVGMITLPPLSQVLLDYYGYQGALLILGAMTLHCVVATALYRPLQEVTAVGEHNSNGTDIKKEPLTPIQLLTVPRFWIATFIFLTVGGGLRIYLNFLIPLARRRLHVEPVTASLLVSIISAVSIIGRVVVGVIADRKVDVLWLLFLLPIATAVNCASVWFIQSYAWMVVNAVLCSLFTSMSHIMFLPVVSIALGDENLKWGIGLTGFTFVALGSITVPFTGMLIDTFDEVRCGYVVATVLLVIGSALHLPLLLRRNA